MHVADGALSVPVLAGATTLAGTGRAIGLRPLEPVDVPRVGMASALFFVASLVHVPVGVASAHLVLSGLMGLLLGWAAFPAFLAAGVPVLIVEAFVTAAAVTAVARAKPELLPCRAEASMMPHHDASSKKRIAIPRRRLATRVVAAIAVAVSTVASTAVAHGLALFVTVGSDEIRGLACFADGARARDVPERLLVDGAAVAETATDAEGRFRFDVPDELQALVDASVARYVGSLREQLAVAEDRRRVRGVVGVVGVVGGGRRGSAGVGHLPGLAALAALMWRRKGDRAFHGVGVEWWFWWWWA